MTKQFESLFPHISDMSDEQLAHHIGEIRRRKYTERPAAAARKVKAERPENSKQVSKVTKLFADMSPEDRAALIAQLEESDDGEQ